VATFNPRQPRAFALHDPGARRALEVCVERECALEVAAADGLEVVPVRLRPVRADALAHFDRAGRLVDVYLDAAAPVTRDFAAEGLLRGEPIVPVRLYPAPRARVELADPLGLVLRCTRCGARWSRGGAAWRCPTGC